MIIDFTNRGDGAGCTIRCLMTLDIGTDDLLLETGADLQCAAEIFLRQHIGLDIFGRAYCSIAWFAAQQRAFTEEAAGAEMLQGTVAGLGFVLELTFLSGRRKLNGYDVYSLIQY